MLNRPIEQMGVLKDGEQGSWLRRVWTVLCRPLPGTKPEPEPVWIEGRLNRVQSFVVLILIILGLAWCAKIGMEAFGKAANARWCVAGWGGYSLGGEITWAMLAFGALFVTILSAWALILSRRVYTGKRLPVIPAAGYRPWLSMRVRVVEGRSAELRGAWGMFLSVIMLLLCAVGWYFWLQLSQKFLVPPAEIKKCNSPTTANADAMSVTKSSAVLSTPSFRAQRSGVAAIHGGAG
jgi:hypothetical protein